MNILINFQCACGYEEPIGVDLRCGVIIEGTVIICPKCGNIVRMDSVRAMVPVKFVQLRR